MPYSEKQRVAAAIAEHEPGKLYRRNRGLLRMGRAKLRDFASGPVEKKVKLSSLRRPKGGS